jgi:hypothetical protein
LLALDFDLRTALAQPYPGLRSFEPAESFLFFGRQVQTNELLRRLSARRMLAVIGTSGSGKSSLVRAGLLPALYRGHLAGAGSTWRIAVMRPGGGPLDKLADSLVEAELFDEADRRHVRETIGRTSLGLVDTVRQSETYRYGSLLLVVDQFEELFRYRMDREREDGGAESSLFVAGLLEAVDQVELPIYVVLTMRSDFLGDCAQFDGLPEALNNNQYLVPRMAREDRQEAIEGPIRVAGAHISVRLVQRVLNDAGDDPDQLPILQHALMATFREWKNRGGEGDIDLVHYERAGTMGDAINRDAQAVLDDLSAHDQVVAQKIFRCLTTIQGGRMVRRPARVEKILGVVDAAAYPTRREQVERIILRFAATEHSFLVLPAGGQLAGDSVVDITHESLIRKWTTLQRWVDAEADSVEWYQSLVRDAELHQTGAVGLWRDPNLKEALLRSRRDQWNQAWAEQYCPGFESVKKFLKRSRSKQQHSRILLGTTIGLVFLTAAAGYAKYKYDLYIDHQRELSLRAEIEKRASDQAQAADNVKQLELKIATMGDPTERKALQQQLDEQRQELTKLKAQSADTVNALDKHKGDQASQDPLLKKAYAQIDSLQAQVNALRQGKCAQGYVWREAFEGDHVCVSPPVRSQVAFDNEHASERRAGSGAYGPDTCKQGYVWRDAFPGDHVCVEPRVRDQAAADNRQAQYRLDTTSGVSGKF